MEEKNIYKKIFIKKNHCILKMNRSYRIYDIFSIPDPSEDFRQYEAFRRRRRQSTRERDIEELGYLFTPEELEIAIKELLGLKKKPNFEPFTSFGKLKRKIHTGSRGGRYIIKNGRKKYL